MQRMKRIDNLRVGLGFGGGLLSQTIGWLIYNSGFGSGTNIWEGLMNVLIWGGVILCCWGCICFAKTKGSRSIGGVFVAIVSGLVISLALTTVIIFLGGRPS